MIGHKKKMIKKVLNSSYFKSVRWGSASIVVTFLNQIVLVPIFLSIFNQNLYGVWIILSTIVLMIRALNLGQLNYASNLINITDRFESEKTQKLLPICFSSNVTMMSLQIVVTFILAIPAVFIFLTNIDLEVFVNNKLTLCIIIFACSKIVYQFYNLYVLRLFEPQGKINITLKYQSIGELLDFLSLAISCYFFKSLIAMCVSSLVVSILYSIAIHFVVMSAEIKYFAKITVHNWIEGLQQIKKSTFLTFSFFLEKFSEVGLNFIVTFFYAITVLPIFSTSRTIANMAIKVSNIIAIPLMPSIQKNYAVKDNTSIMNSFNLYWKFSLLIIIITFTILFPFVDPLYYIWTKNKIEFNKVLFMTILIGVIMQNFNVILIEFVKKTNQTKNILFLNFLKLVTVCCVLYIYSFVKDILGIGYSIVVAEGFVLLFLIIFLRKKNDLKILYRNLIFNTLFAGNILNYIFFQNYWTFLFFNLVIIIIIQFRRKILSTLIKFN